MARARPRSAGSRAIGIHPPSLALLETLGVLEAFVTEGVRIERAQAFSTRRRLGAVDLRRAGDRFGFVLALPQERTEALLEARLGERLVRGAAVTDLEAHAAFVDVVAADGEQQRARWVIGCDGGRSLVAASLGSTLTGRRSRAAYLMGDFDDDTSFGSDAAIFLADEGLVESFPLPRARRRWVVQVDGARAEAQAGDIAEAVERRTGQRIDAGSARMLSAFGVQQLLAGRLAGGRCVLAGDAAHLISPFGGQGMNLGWADAWDVAACLARILREGADAALELEGYGRRRRGAARRAMRRASFNGAVGRRSRLPRARNAAAGALLALAPQPVLARLFTMQPWWSADGRCRPQPHGDAIGDALGEARAGRQP